MNTSSAAPLGDPARRSSQFASSPSERMDNNSISKGSMTAAATASESDSVLRCSSSSSSLMIDHPGSDEENEDADMQGMFFDDFVGIFDDDGPTTSTAAGMMDLHHGNVTSLSAGDSVMAIKTPVAVSYGNDHRGLHHERTARTHGHDEDDVRQVRNNIATSATTAKPMMAETSARLTSSIVAIPTDGSEIALQNANGKTVSLATASATLIDGTTITTPSSANDVASTGKRRRSSACIEGGDRGLPPPLWHSEAADKQHRQAMIVEIAKLLQARKKTQPTADWLRQLPHKARKLEERLYRNAQSLQAYLDRTTLKNRLKRLARTIIKQYRDGRTTGVSPRGSMMLSSQARSALLTRHRDSASSQSSISSFASMASSLSRGTSVGSAQTADSSSVMSALQKSLTQKFSVANRGDTMGDSDRSDGSSSHSQQQPLPPSSQHRTSFGRMASNLSTIPETINLPSSSASVTSTGTIEVQANKNSSNNMSAASSVGSHGTSMQPMPDSPSPPLMQDHPGGSVPQQQVPGMFLSVSSNNNNASALERQKAVNERHMQQIMENIRRQQEMVRNLQGHDRVSHQGRGGPGSNSVPNNSPGLSSSIGPISETIGVSGGGVGASQSQKTEESSNRASRSGGQGEFAIVGFGSNFSAGAASMTSLGSANMVGRNAIMSAMQTNGISQGQGVGNMQSFMIEDNTGQRPQSIQTAQNAFLYNSMNTGGSNAANAQHALSALRDLSSLRQQHAASMGASQNAANDLTSHFMEQMRGGFSSSFLRHQAAAPRPNGHEVHHLSSVNGQLSFPQQQQHQLDMVRYSAMMSANSQYLQANPVTGPGGGGPAGAPPTGMHAMMPGQLMNGLNPSTPPRYMQNAGMPVFHSEAETMKMASNFRQPNGTMDESNESSLSPGSFNW